jgi:hypothetical protein
VTALLGVTTQPGLIELDTEHLYESEDVTMCSQVNWSHANGVSDLYPLSRHPRESEESAYARRR